MRSTLISVTILCLAAVLVNSPTGGAQLAAVSDVQNIRTIDTGPFTIELDEQWTYVKQQGFDSFVGDFESDGVTLAFDYSRQGYSWPLYPSTDQYLESTRWVPLDLFHEKGVVYVSPRSNWLRLEVFFKYLFEEGRVQKVEFLPRTEFETWTEANTDNRLDADFIGHVRYRDQEVYIPIALPENMKCSRISFRQTEHFSIKISEKICEDFGVTGILFEHLESNFTFGLYSKDPTDEKGTAELLRAFETIRFRDYAL